MTFDQFITAMSGTTHTVILTTNKCTCVHRGHVDHVAKGMVALDELDPETNQSNGFLTLITLEDITHVTYERVDWERSYLRHLVECKDDAVKEVPDVA